MISAGFYRSNRVGAWVVLRKIEDIPTRVEVDLMVPETAGGLVNRAAQLSGQVSTLLGKLGDWRPCPGIPFDEACDRHVDTIIKSPSSFPPLLEDPYAFFETTCQKLKAVKDKNLQQPWYY